MGPRGDVTRTGPVGLSPDRIAVCPHPAVTHAEDVAMAALGSGRHVVQIAHRTLAGLNERRSIGRVTSSDKHTRHETRK